MKIIKYFILVLVFSSLASCGDKKVDPKYVPKLNPNPKYTFTVTGKIDNDLKKDSKFLWAAIYRSTNDKCRYTDNYIEGSRTYRVKNDSFEVPKNTNQYSHSFYIDKYMPGFCNWKLQAVRFSATVSGTPFVGTVLFNLKSRIDKKSMKNDAIVNIVCASNKGDSCNEQISSYFTDKTPSELAQEGNYVYELNLLRK